MFDFYLSLSLFAYLSIALAFLRFLFPSHLLSFFFISFFLSLSLSPLSLYLLLFPQLPFSSLLSLSHFSFSLTHSSSLLFSSFSFYLYLSPSLLILSIFSFFSLPPFLPPSTTLLSLLFPPFLVPPCLPSFLFYALPLISLSLMLRQKHLLLACFHSR